MTEPTKTDDEIVALVVADDENEDLPYDNAYDFGTRIDWERVYDRIEREYGREITNYDDPLIKKMKAAIRKSRKAAG